MKANPKTICTLEFNYHGGMLAIETLKPQRRYCYNPRRKPVHGYVDIVADSFYGDDYRMPRYLRCGTEFFVAPHMIPYSEFHNHIDIEVTLYYDLTDRKFILKSDMDPAIKDDFRKWHDTNGDDITDYRIMYRYFVDHTDIVRYNWIDIHRLSEYTTLVKKKKLNKSIDKYYNGFLNIAKSAIECDGSVYNIAKLIRSTHNIFGEAFASVLVGNLRDDDDDYKFPTKEEFKNTLIKKFDRCPKELLKIDLYEH